MKRLLLLTLILHFNFIAFCQYREIHFDRISDQQGLYDHWVKCILQDCKGFIWIGGEYGLYRYDGYNIINFKDPPGCKNCPHFYPVYDLVEDSLGMLWTISSPGVTVFDPENLRSWIVYRFSGAGASSGGTFLNGRKLDLNKDSDGNIWATGDMGLIRFSYKKDVRMKEMKSDSFPESFLDINLFQFSKDNNSHENVVIKIYTDSEGNTWAGCEDGLYVLRKGDSGFYRFEIEAEMKAVSRTYISDILEQNKDTFWILSGTNNYIMSNVQRALSGSAVDGSLLSFRNFTLAKNQLNLTLYKDKKNRIIIGISFNVFRYMGRDKKGDPVFQQLYDLIPAEQNNLLDIENIIEDRSGMMWVAHRLTGITKFNPAGSPFISYFNSTGYYLDCDGYNLEVLRMDSEGDILMGAINKGLYRIEKNTGHITRYDLGLYGNQIDCLQEIRPGIFWAGIIKGGILEVNKFTGRSHDPLPEDSLSNKLRRSQVNDILKDQNLLYLTSDSGIFVYDLDKKRLTRFLFPYNSVTDMNNWTGSPLKLRSGEIIFFTYSNGINKITYDPEKCNISLTCLIPDSVLKRSDINLMHISSPYQDSHGLLWIGGKSGLHKIDLEKAEINDYRLFRNIDYPEAKSVIEDNNDNLWIGTFFGLCRFNIKSGDVKVFSQEDGLPISMHFHNSVFNDRAGWLYFGGAGGYYRFHPDSIKTNICIPQVVITDFKLFNKSVSVDTTKKAILTKNISYTSQIELRHDQNDISFEFASLDFTIPSRNQYAYKLEGYQVNWMETDANNRVATYTNLDPGRYTFRVKGSNNDGIWNEEGASLTVIIMKPWWGTTLAWCIYALVLIGTISAYIRWRIYKLKREKLYLENQVHKRTLQIEDQKEKILYQRDMLEQQNRQIMEHEQLKSRFFTNVSHEFRTPLSLIQSPVEEMLDDPRRTEKERRKLNMVHRNTRRLLNLVNQLLDISKIDGSRMKLELVEDDIMKYIRAIAGSFCSLAESKRIRYTMHFSRETVKTRFDPDKLEKIATNLLSNAFRFTPEAGEIIFSAGYKDCTDGDIKCFLEFSVKDTGPGIPDDSLEKIFDRFYQVESSLKKEGGGAGIGLSLAREVARLMHGDITVQSKAGEGSIFTVTLPLGIEHLKESEFIMLNEAPETIGFIPELHETWGEAIEDQQGKPADDKELILIVEDNRDIRTQLSDNFSREYNIIEASDGIAGLEKAREMIPDLIITDLMMPGIDGIELCVKVKVDERTCHIPVIMLTARVTLEEKIAGYRTGADDYIPKPFQMEELKVRVANLLEQRKKLRERFSREVTLEPGDIAITPLDEKFLNRAKEIIENHMHDESFGIAVLRQEMFMTRSTLFRKIHALTNQSPGEFIRTIRLKRAADLLQQNFGNITQVAFTVGFNNLTSFNRAFRKLYGLSPTEYKKKNTVNRL